MSYEDMALWCTLVLESRYGSAHVAAMGGNFDVKITWI